MINKLPEPNTDIDIVLPESTKRDLPGFVDFSENAKGDLKPSNTADNLQAMAEYCGIGFRLNMMEYEPDVCDPSGEKIHITYDQLRSELISSCSRTGLAKAVIDDHLIALSENNKYHPVKEWLEQGEWDGVERVESVIKCLNAEDQELAKIIMKRWLVGCVAAVYEPYFNNKLVPVLQGGQTFKKTAFIQRIANVIPNAYVEGEELNPDNKDSVLTSIRAWIVELGELERTSKNSQGALKAFLTKGVDSVRPPYGRKDIKKPRQTLFIATVNEGDFLKDSTGSSRYGVIKLNEAVNIDKVNDILGWRFTGTGKLDRENPELLKQFWLEVKMAYLQGEAWVLSEEESNKTRKANEPFNDKGAIYNYILDNYIEADDSDFPVIFPKWFTAGQLAKEDSDLQAHQVGQIGKALKRLADEQLLDRKTAGSNKVLYSLSSLKPSN